VKLKIDPDFKNMIPALNPDEYRQLEQNIIAANQCREAILVWNGYIVDGHNRYDICQRHNIPFRISKLRFASKAEALIWIANHQLGRRNLSDAQRIELASCMAEMLRQKAKENLAFKGKVDEHVNVQKSIAAAAGVSEQMVHRYMKVVGSADPEMIEQLRRGEIRVNTAYGRLIGESRVVREIDVGFGKGEEDEFGVLDYGSVIGWICRSGRVYGGLIGAGRYGEGDGFRGCCEGQLGVVDELLGWFEQA